MTGDTAPPPEPAPCPDRVTGSGCGWEARDSTVTCGEDGQPSTEPEPLPGEVQGGACGCSVPQAGPLLPVLAVLFYRWLRPLLLLLLALPAAAQVDAEHAEILDGGAFPLLRDADLGAKWSAAATLSANYAQNPVVIEEVPRSGPLLAGVLTQMASGMATFGGVLQAGVAVPRHSPVRFRDEAGLRAPGDTTVWLAVPVTLSESPLRGSWTVQLEIPTGDEALYLGDPGNVSGIVALSFPAGPLTAALNLGATFQRDVPLPGAVWGNHWAWGIGLREEPVGPTWVTLEALGEAPVKAWAGVPAQYPVQTALSAGAVISGIVSLGAGVGTGLSRGLGSPDLRVLALLDLRRQDPRDSDGDGIGDFTDLCRAEPEDRDGYRDRDGCPDEDNDRDGLVDAWDDCPNVPESLDGYKDDDGCPDEVTHLVVHVDTEGGAQTASVYLGDEAPVRTFPGEPVKRTLEGAHIRVRVEASGHHPEERDVTLPRSGQVVVELTLAAIRMGTVRVAVVDPSGGVVEGAELHGVGPEPLPASEDVVVPAGLAEWEVAAEGYVSAPLRVEVPPDAVLPVEVILRPTGVTVRGARIEVGEIVGFALDDSKLDPESTAALDDLAGWLAARTDVVLLRVEGHADESGSSAYNYELSQARARTVHDYLVERGVEAGRLQAIGSGEARPAELGDRRVEFTVLVWAGE